MDLRVFQSLWGMGGLPMGAEQEWSLTQKIAAIVDGS